MIQENTTHLCLLHLSLKDERSNNTIRIGLKDARIGSQFDFFIFFLWSS